MSLLTTTTTTFDVTTTTTTIDHNHNSIFKMRSSSKGKAKETSTNTTTTISATRMAIQQAARRLHRQIQRKTSPVPIKREDSNGDEEMLIATTSSTPSSSTTSTVLKPLARSVGVSSPPPRQVSSTMPASTAPRQAPATTMTAPAHPQPSLYEAVFGAQIAQQLEQAVAISQPKTLPPSQQSQRSQRPNAVFQLPSTPQRRTPQYHSSVTPGMSARLHKLSSTPQLGSPERARRGGPPVGVDPHNSPSPQHLEREDALAFAHPHQSYVFSSPRTPKKRATSSGTTSPTKRKRTSQDLTINAVTIPTTPKKQTLTPHSTGPKSKFADPKSITPRRARVMAPMDNHHNTGITPVTPPTRRAVLPDDGHVPPSTTMENSKEADLLLFLANSPTVKQQQQHRTPSLLDSIERRNSRHRTTSANHLVARTLFPTNEPGEDRRQHTAEARSLGPSPAIASGKASHPSPVTSPLMRRASSRLSPQATAVKRVTSEWDSSDSDDEADKRPKNGFTATPLSRSSNNEELGPPRTPSPVPTVSSEPRTPHTPNTSSFTYSEFINVSPSPNPGSRSRMNSSNGHGGGRFPSCNGHLVGLEDAMTWTEAISRLPNNNNTKVYSQHSTPTKTSSSSSRKTYLEEKILTPGPIHSYSTSPTFSMRSETSKRRQRLDSGPHQRSTDTGEAVGALPFNAGFKPSHTHAEGESPEDEDKKSNVGLGLSY